MNDTGPREKERLEQARAGDADAFADAFEQHRPLLHRLAYRMVGPTDCDDVVMETYLKAWQSLPRFRGSASLKTWLCRIARNCALDFLRKRQRQQGRQVDWDDPEAAPVVERLPDTGAPAPDREAQKHDLRQILDRAMEQLGEKHRTVLLLREVDGLAYREIAAATGANIGTVMSRLYHARRKLRAILEKGQWEID